MAARVGHGLDRRKHCSPGFEAEAVCQQRSSNGSLRTVRPVDTTNDLIPQAANPLTENL